MFQTSVFIPVLGSSTSVIADSTMTAPVVIETLLEKFKVSVAYCAGVNEQQQVCFCSVLTRLVL